MRRACAPAKSLERSRFNWKRPGQHEEQQHAQAVNVARRARVLEAEDLGRHVGRRADDLEARGSVRLAELSSGAEVHEDDAAAVLAHHVLRLDVAVNDADAMDGTERAAHVVAEIPGFIGAEPALPFRPAPASHRESAPCRSRRVHQGNARRGP